MTALTVPASMEEIIQHYDAMGEPFTQHHISSELNAARGALVDLSRAEFDGAWAEVLAFALDTDSHGNPWNSYFGPTGSKTYEDGTVVYFPDIKGTAAITVDHWVSRSRSVQHPFLKSRYADLAWEMAGPIGGRKRDPDDARLAIDSYLQAIPRMAEDHEHLQFAIRALDLAVQIRDEQRRDCARLSLMEVHRALMAAKSGMWWYAVDRLLEDKKAGVTDAERAELVANLEHIVTASSDISDPTRFNPHDAQHAAEKLIRYYGRVGRFDDVKRLHNTVGETFEHFASNADPMLAAALLQTATDEYRSAGMKEDRDRTRIMMQEKISAAGENLQSFEHKMEIPRDEMEKFLDLVVVDDLATSLVHIAREFLLKRAELERQVAQTLKDAPLMAHIPASIMGNNLVTAKIGSVAEDPYGRLVHQTNFEFQLGRAFLAQAFRRLFEKHEELVPEHFVGWANRHDLFKDMGLLLEGVRAWVRDDQVKATHVLIPQIERGLRKLASDLSVPITKPHPGVPETSVAIGMGEILYNDKVAEALGPDVTLHLQALYADPRGMNLRNQMAHGLMDAGQFYWHLGNLIVHSLLVLGLWKEFGERSKRDTEG